MLLRIKRLLFRWMPWLGLILAKWSSPPRRLELEAVAAIAPLAHVAIDIGASWGLYTYLLSRTARKVIAFEPNPEKAEYIRRAFGARNVEVHAVALSDEEGVAELAVPAQASAFATIEKHNPLFAEGGYSNIRVPRRRLDQYRLNDVALIKLDVEGHEMSALFGAHSLIAEQTPIIYARLERRHHPANPGQPIAFLSGLGYRGLVLDGRAFIDAGTFDVERDQPPENARGSAIKGRYLYNFLFFTDASSSSVLAALRRAGFSTPASGGRSS